MVRDEEGQSHCLFDWAKYDQANVVYRPAQMSGDELRLGQSFAYETFYAPSSIARRFPLRGGRSRLQWSIYNLFMKRGSATDRKEAIAEPTEAPDVSPMPPILPLKREWRQAVLEGTEAPGLILRNRQGVALGLSSRPSNIEWKNYVSRKGGQVRLVVISTPSAKLRVNSEKSFSEPSHCLDDSP